MIQRSTYTHTHTHIVNKLFNVQGNHICRLDCFSGNFFTGKMSCLYAKYNDRENKW